MLIISILLVIVSIFTVINQTMSIPNNESDNNSYICTEISNQTRLECMKLAEDSITVPETNSKLTIDNLKRNR